MSLTMVLALRLPLLEGPLGGMDQVYRPVSYTHLRAHETVLDLVCRLLLEKKKKLGYSVTRILDRTLDDL